MGKAPRGKEDRREGLDKSSTCEMGMQVPCGDTAEVSEESALREGSAENRGDTSRSVPPKYSIAMTIGYLKGKSAVRIHRQVLGTKGTLFGRSFWARGYCVSTVGLDEHQIRQYIKKQEKLEKDQEQMDLDFD